LPGKGLGWRHDWGSVVLGVAYSAPLGRESVCEREKVGKRERKSEKKTGRDKEIECVCV